MNVVRKILKIFLSILIAFILIINIPIMSFGLTFSEEDYSQWMSETVNNEELVVNIAMIGAHDAFSNEIGMFSTVDPYESNTIFRGVPGSLLKGYLVKQAKTQSGDVSQLLTGGVRYLDIRLSYLDDIWYTKHNYISGEFESIALNIISFLESNQGEFLILDFQHINGVSYDSLEDYMLFLEMLEAYGILDYTYEVSDLATLTYGELTENGTKSKIIILAPFLNAENKILEYSTNMRSKWADSDNFEFVIDFLENEADLASEYKHQFRVMQAVTTMQLSPKGIMNSFVTWSLINRADQFNEYLVNDGRVEDLMSTLPIIMIDNAGTNKNDLTDNLMDIIIEYNKK